MDSIELQITGALDHYMPQLPPSCSSSRPGTPGDALASPTTGNSVLLSRPVSEDAGRKSKRISLLFFLDFANVDIARDGASCRCFSAKRE